MRKICYGIFFLLLATGMLSFPSSTKAQVSVGISITSPPPPLPVYIQPLCPGPRYIWTPGYWAWGPDGYYWAPGTWVLAPEVGLYWTPGYWGWGDDVYVWHAGFWGPTVGFYGGIDYGFGYTGVGYVGGYWRGGVFVYNRSVNRIDTTEIHNTYYKTVEDRSFSHVSYNGGRGGIDARPTARQEAAARERRIGATAAQVRQERLARSDRQQLASENRGRPAVAATQRPGDFQYGSVAARGGAERNASYRVDNSRLHAAETRSSRTGSSGARNSRTGNTAAKAGAANSRERASAREEKTRAGTTPTRTEHTAPAARTSHATPERAPQPARSAPQVNESHNTRPSGEAASHGQPSHAPAPRENTSQQHAAPQGGGSGARGGESHNNNANHGHEQR
jgi:hypothetical protein